MQRSRTCCKRQLGSSWHELQPDDGPLKFSAGPWAADPDGSTLRAYLPYWERGLMDSFIHGGKETVREVFARRGRICRCTGDGNALSAKE